MVWATRGRYWVFRFLMTGGFPDPLIPFERAFKNASNDESGVYPSGEVIALRFNDPEGRTDDFGRVIPHEFVLFGEEAEGISSLEEGIAKVWPTVSERYAQVWEDRKAPISFDI